MKTVIYEKYGAPEVLKLREINKPEPKADEVLIKIHAATVTSGDVRLRSSDFPPLFWLPARLIFGLFKPKKKILGHEFAGIVEATGKDVTDLKVGDHVFGTTTMLPVGSYSEYICLPQKWKHGVIGLKPENLSFLDAAALPVGAMTAMYLWDKTGLKSQQRVLVYGASGSVGTYAVQLARQKGAEVTGVCSASNFDMVRSMGVEDLIDYRKENYTSRSEKFDIVFDAVGKTSKSKARKVLKKDGKFVSVNMITKESLDNLQRIKTMAEKGHLIPHIDSTFGLDEIVEAHTYVDKGHKKGNVVVEIVR